MPDRNPTPKERFVADKKAVTAHVNVFSLEPAQRSIDVALLQYQRRLTSNEEVDARDLYNRIKGAQEFVATLLNLAENPQPVPAAKTGNLTHQS